MAPDTVKAPTGSPKGAVTYDGSGKRGLFRYGGQRVDTGEYVPELLDHRSAVEEYARIGRKSHLAALRRSVRLVLEGFTVWLDQDEADESTWRRVAANLGLPTAVDGPTPDLGGIDWTWLFGRMLDAPIDFGHYFAEMEAVPNGSVYFPGAMWLAALESRPQNTLHDARVDRAGRLVSVEQQGFDDPRPVEIPAERLVHIVHDARDGDPWGQPILRACWEAEFYRQTATALSMEALEFGGNGVVASEWTNPDRQPTQEDIDDRDAVLANWKATGGVGSTGSWRFTMLSPSGGVDHLAHIKHHEQKMSAAFMAHVLELGTTGQGNRALGDTFDELWLRGCASLANSVIQQAQRQLVRRLVDWNEGPDAKAPVLKLHTGEGVDVLDLPDMAAAVDAGLVQRSMDLVRANHARYGLPAPEGDELPEPKAAPVATPPSVAPRPDAPLGDATEKVTAAADAGHRLLRRDPTTIEAAAKTDFEAIAKSWETQTAKLASAVDAERRTIGKQLASAVGDLAVADKLDDLPAVPVGRDLLVTTYRKAVDDGAASALAEAKAQDAPTPKVQLDAAYAAAEATAAGYAGLIGDEVRAAVKAQALVSYGQGASSGDITAAAASHVATLSDASVVDRAGAGLVASTGEGRLAAMAAVSAALSGTKVEAAASGGVLARVRNFFRRQAAETVEAVKYYGSSVLDRTSCARCVADDGREFTTLAAAQQVYPSGAQHGACEGRGRCRCLVVAVYNNETPAVN